MPKNSLSLPDHLVQLLSAADARTGLPAGTMFSLMQQEIGGQEDRFLADPTLPHYPTGVAPNGKKSSAFGPFGILESTGRDPGFGVAPLKDKSLEEQIRFASDYAKARGLANYGEGEKYAAQVVARRDGTQPPAQVQAPVIAAAPAEQAAPVVLAQVATQSPLAPAPANLENDPWTQFLRQSAAAGAQVTPDGLAYGHAASTPGAPRQGMSPEEVAALYDIPINAGRPSMGVFRGLGRKTA